MKQFFALILLALAASGCHPQQPPAPYYTCPASSGTAYASLNGGTTGLSTLTGSTYVDTTAAGTTECYIVQSQFQGGTSVPSNTAGPLVVPAGYQVNLSWTPPANSTGYTYLVSRAAAVATYPTAPVLATPTTVADAVKPDTKDDKVQTARAPTNLSGSVT